MKILHIESGKHLYGGAQQVMFLLRKLPDFDVESTLFCDDRSSIKEVCEQEGIPTFSCRIAGDLDLKLPSHIKQACKEIQPDLIHVHSRRGVDFWGGWVAKQLGIPCVISRRVDNPEPHWLAKRKYEMYDHVITISDGIRQVLLSEGVPSEKVSLVRSALELESYPDPIKHSTFQKRFDIPADAIVVGCAAQLIKRKGHRFLIDALPEVVEQFPNLRVVCFGKGKEFQNLGHQACIRGLEDIVSLPGFVDDIKTLYPHFDILVHPAQMEGLGVALIEASYARVPIIATKVGGIPEIVRDGKNGILIPPSNINAIRDALLKLLNDVTLRKTLGNTGHELATTEFSTTPMAKGNAEIYRKVLASKNS